MHEPNKLPLSAVIGIVVGSILSVVLGFLGLLWFHQRRKAIKSDGESSSFKIYQEKFITSNSQSLLTYFMDKLSLLCSDMIYNF